MIERGEYGPVRIIGGRYKGLTGTYDDDTRCFAVVLIRDDDWNETFWAHISLRFLVPIEAVSVLEKVYEAIYTRPQWVKVQPVVNDVPGPCRVVWCYELDFFDAPTNAYGGRMIVWPKVKEVITLGLN